MKLLELAAFNDACSLARGGTHVADNVPLMRGEAKGMKSLGWMRVEFVTDNLLRFKLEVRLGPPSVFHCVSATLAAEHTADGWLSCA